MNRNELTGSKYFYGWKIAVALLVINTFVSGLSFYNHAVILNALSLQPQFTVQSVSLAVSIFFLSSGLTGLWVAKLLKDYDPRLCICAGAAIAGISLALLGLVENTWQLYLVYALFGAGFCASGLVPATTLITRWFHKKRAVALSIASTGLSLGGVVLTPISALMVDFFGLAKAAPAMGFVYFIGVAPIALVWLRASPESIGLNVDGEKAEQATAVSAADENASSQVENRNNKPMSFSGLTYSEALNTRLFWAISIAYIFLMLAQVGGIAHQYGLSRAILSESEAAMIVAILPVASIIGRLVGGWVIGQMSIRLFAILMMVFQAVSLGLLGLGSGVVVLCIGLAFFGVSVGNLLMLQPLLIAEIFGTRDYAKIFSFANLLSSLGTAAGPSILGVVYALSQNQYSVAYLVASLSGVIGLALFLYGGAINRVEDS